MKAIHHLKSVQPLFRSVLFLLALFLCTSIARADVLKVKSLTHDPIDLEAAVKSKQDNNGNPCALLKIILPKEATNVRFEGNTIDIQNNGVEFYVYMPSGTKYLTIKSADTGPLEIFFPNYKIPFLEGKRTYNITIIKKVSTKMSFRPTKNKFNFYVLSGFSNPVGFGGGIGFNYSYFQLSIDGAASVGGEGIRDGMLSTDNVKNCVKLKNGGFAQGKMQLAISPGVNLKYFGASLGLGTLLTKELTNLETFNPTYGRYYKGEEISKSRFLIRPTVEGYIPFDKDFSCGLKLMVGYNMVSGLSDFNQIIIGLGLFF